MKEFKDKVAVVTGAASGIGRAIAERCVHEGMKVVLADIDAEALTQREAEMKAAGATVLAVPADVSQAKHVEALAQETLDAFGAVHVLVNNAGVGALASVWETTITEWEWIIGVNLWGVIHGVRVFVPIMLGQDTACHVVNTASMAGLTTAPWLGPYQITKHGVVALSETLYRELAQRGSNIKVSVLCPGFVKTRIMEVRLSRPMSLPATREGRREYAERWEAMREAFRSGMPPARVADVVFTALREDRFYIFTHPEMKERVRTRMEDILQERHPTLPSV